MKKTLASLGLPISLIFAVICLTIRVGRADLGGFVGTLVVQPSASDDAIAQTAFSLRISGIVCLGMAAFCIKCLVQKPDHFPNMLSPSHRPPRYPRLFRSGLFVFAAGILGGFIFVAKVGSDSPEFQNYFGYFIAIYAIGTILILLGK